MVATTDQKARLLDLVTGILELTRDGRRDAEEIGAVLQVIKDDPEFARRLLAPSGNAIAPSAFLRDMKKEGWTLVEDVFNEPLQVAQLKLVSFLKPDENYIEGEEMKKRAEKKNAALGQRQAEYLLEHQEEIPSEWRNYYLVFPGTIWRYRHGYLDVPCLRWYGVGWDLDFFRLGHGWDDCGRLLRSK